MFFFFFFITAHSDTSLMEEDLVQPLSFSFYVFPTILYLSFAFRIISLEGPGL